MTRYARHCLPPRLLLPLALSRTQLNHQLIATKRALPAQDKINNLKNQIRALLVRRLYIAKILPSSLDVLPRSKQRCQVYLESCTDIKVLTLRALQQRKMPLPHPS